ncbi:MAG TPA: hypothetical protein VHW65_05755 [Gemmatimonadales bacterium]|jgi:hypothetical protein|nr:hypothetical protein [Gemmatimonadales bacterium]
MNFFETAFKVLFLVGGIMVVRVLWWRGGGSVTGGGSLKRRLADVEARLAELEHRGLTTGESDAHLDRLAELEERVDFAERVIAKRDVAALPEPGAPR